MTYGDAMSTIIPSVGAAGTGYATSINARLAEIETILESDVPFSSLTGSELDLNNVPIRDATYVELIEGASAPGASPVGRLARYQNNLYWVTDEGAVRITVNGALDSSSIGGIGGDYGGANPSLVTFDEGTSQYRFYENYSTTTWGYLRSRGLDIADGAATTDMVRLRAPAIAASYDLTLPTAPPVTTNLVMMNTSGEMIFNGSPATNLSFASNTDVILTGTGKIRHESRRFHVGLSGHLTSTGAHTLNPGFLFSGTAGIYYLAVHGWQENWRFKTLVVDFLKTSGGTMTVDLQRWAAGALAATVATNTTTTNGAGTVTATAGTPATITAADALWVKVTMPANNDTTYSVVITYDVV